MCLQYINLNIIANICLRIFSIYFIICDSWSSQANMSIQYLYVKYNIIQFSVITKDSHTDNHSILSGLGWFGYTKNLIDESPNGLP